MAIDVVGIYLSTTSNITQLAPSRETIDGDRVSDDTTLVPPFTELSLDIFAPTHFTGSSKDMTLEKVRSIRVAASLGRPLYVLIFGTEKLSLTCLFRWSAHLKANYPIFFNLRLAETKLTGTVQKDWSDIPQEGQSALLSVRLLIHRTKNQAGRKLTESLIKSHMATVFMINGNRSLLLAGYPPEPFLAAAAVRTMPPDYNTWVSCLKTMIANDYVSRGDRGELISRVLLTIAHDLARQDEMNRIDPAETLDPTLESVLPRHEPVLVCDFLRHFVGERERETVANARPFNMAADDPESRTLKDFLGEYAWLISHALE
jgi:hypothetical protein